MKRNIGKHISSKARQLKEDMKELQRLMRHKSVYARQTIGNSYARRPKHPKRMYDMHEGLY
jgi:hypothetical protein